MIKSQNKSTLAIKIELVRKNVSTTLLAKQLNRPRTTVSTAIHNPNRFPRVRQEIIKTLFE